MKGSFNAESNTAYDVAQDQSTLKVGVKDVTSVTVYGNVRPGDTMTPIAVFNVADWRTVEDSEIKEDGIYEIPVYGLAQVKFVFASGTVAVTVI